MKKRILSVVLSLTLLLSLVSVAGIATTASAEVVVTPVTDLPVNNLLAGLRPVSGVSGQTALSSAYSSAPEWLTDGQLCAADNSTGRWVGYTSTGCLIAFNVGAMSEMDSFLVSSEGVAAQYADKVKIYVSDTVVDPRTGLFTADNLVLETDSLTGQTNLLTLDTAVSGVMVGFDFTGSKCNAGDLIRLGELGAYGTKNTALANTTVTAVTAIPTETNLLTDLTPTGGYGAKINNATGKIAQLNDGVLCDDNNSKRWGGYYGNGDMLVWDLGSPYDITKVLVGSENSYKEYVKYVRVYVGDEVASLFSEANLAFAAAGYATGIGANRDNLLSAVDGKTYTGQYVGFDFTDNDPARGGSVASFLRLGELGVYGKAASFTKAPANNLLAGLRPVSGVSGQTSLSSAYGSAPEWLTDGQLCAADNSTGRWVGYTSTGCLIAFNLGATATMDSFFVSSEGAAAQYADKVKIYVSETVVDPRAGLFTADNLVLETDSLTGQSNLLTLDKAVSGVMVGFDFTGSKCNAGELIRLGELGAYGTKNAALANTIVTAVTAIPTEDNLLAGLTPTGGYGVKINNATGKIAQLNDGVLCEDNGTQTWGGYYGNGDMLIWNLGKRCNVANVLVGSQNSYKEYVKYVRVYIGNNPSTLFSETNLAFATAGYATGIGANRDNLLSAVDGKTYTGQYVGFDFTDNDPARAGSMQSYLRLGELGVYGTVAEVQSLAPGANVLDSSTISLVPDTNLLAEGTKLSGNLQGGNSNLPVLTDGIIGGINSEEYAIASFIGIDGAVVTADGKTVDKVTGMATAAFQLKQTAKIDTLVVAGSAGDSTAFGSVGYNNRDVVYYEVYIGRDYNNLFQEENRVLVFDQTADSHMAHAHVLSEAVVGSVVGFKMTSAAYSLTRLSELGVYGTYQDIDRGENLLAGDLPVLYTQVDARGIDNKTAVDVDGNAGKGNTGALSGQIKVWSYEDLAGLTDGTTDVGSTQFVSAGPSENKTTSNRLLYDTPWIVLVYKLDGKTRIDEVSLSSTAEPDYYVAGVQYYASESYADLFKNESLLYTSGGERYVKGSGDVEYLPDVTYDKKGTQTIAYATSAEQKTKLYRYVAIVMTRPYSLYKLSNPAAYVIGYNGYRVGELAVYGEVVEAEEPIKDTYMVQTSVGEVSVQVGALHFDDRAFFENTLGGVAVTESALPETVSPHIEENMLSVDIDTVFTFQLLDKQGNPIPETAEKDADGINGREVELLFPSTAAYTQTMAVLEGNTLRRLYNSYNDGKLGNKVTAGCLEYPVYEDIINNRDKAILSGGTFSLVYMKANDIHTVNALNNQVVNESLQDFMVTENTAGATAEGPTSITLWVAALPALLILTVLVWRVCRKADRANH